MSDLEQLWLVKQTAEKAEKAASVAHEAAEREGSGPAYEAAFKALTDARVRLQLAEEQYDAAQAVK